MGLFSKKSDEDTGSGNRENPIETYKVNYRGGHPDYPKAKVGAIVFQLFPDRFELKPTGGTKWFDPLTIPFKTISDFKIVGHQVGTAEGIFGGLNSRQLNQDNNINISFLYRGQDIILRLEMLTGVTVMGQAKKCKELVDRLTTYGVKQQFSAGQSAQASSQLSAADELAKLAKLKEQGIVTQEEFNKKKAQILGL